MKEIWKDIIGYEGLYQVSNLGRIKSLPRNGTVKEQKILKQTLDTNGYLTIGLHKNNKAKKINIHRIVAETFVANINNYNIINHKDGNKQNNRVDNLEWCTQKHNIKEAIRLGLQIPYNKKPVFQYDKNGNFIKKYNSVCEAERKTKIFQSNISKCCLKQRHSAGGFVWRYKEEI